VCAKPDLELKLAGKLRENEIEPNGVRFDPLQSPVNVQRNCGEKSRNTLLVKGLDETDNQFGAHDVGKAGNVSTCLLSPAQP